MEIQINKKNASEFFVKKNKIKWKIYQRSKLFVIIIFLIFGIILFIVGLNKGYTSSMSNYRYNEGKTIRYVNTVQNNYHISLGLGIAFIIFSFYIFLLFFLKQKKQFFDNIDKISNRLKSSSNYYGIKITEKSLYYEDDEMKIEESWVTYTNYCIYENYILIYQNESDILNSWMIDRKLIVETDLSELLKFLNKKLIRKKYFFLN